MNGKAPAAPAIPASPASASPAPAPAGIAPEIIARREGVAGHLSLNRPRAIHALTAPMVEAMIAALLEWRDDAGVAIVLIDHAAAPDGDPRLSRGFCSGGDIAMLRHSGMTDGGAEASRFFRLEYQLNALIFNYEKPSAAFMDGITMGGGVGISQPATWRVATENTRYAMPESGIGLFPDVGGGWYLSRLPGRIGQYLALTGARIDGADCLWAGLATHYLPAAALPAAKRRLAAGEAPDAVLAGLAAPAPASQLAAHAADIARHFASDRLEDIYASLAADPGEWAQATLATLRGKSPLTCKVALRQLATSLTLPDFNANMAMEYRIGSRLVVTPDFIEGVRAVIIDKDHAPRWSAAKPEDVREDALAAIFAPLPPAEEWTAL